MPSVSNGVGARPAPLKLGRWVLPSARCVDDVMPICADEVPLEVLFILKPAATSQPTIKPSRTRSTNPRTYGGRFTKAGARQAKKATSVATLSRARIFKWPARPNDSGTCAIARERRTAAMGKARNATIAAPAPGSLLVVDGTAIGPIESKSSRATLQRLSRADLIESITVLKASSTVAPYGPAGSKGVLLVVTKAARAPH